VAWFHPNGTLDTDLGDGGTLIDDVGEDLSPSGMIEFASHKIVLAGAYRTGPATFELGLVRLRTDGQPDALFGPNGLVTRDLGGDGDYAGELRRAGTRLLVATSHVENDETHIGVIRLNLNGSLDTAFGDQGLALSTLGNVFGSALALAGDGRIVVAGNVGSVHVTTRFLAARFLAS
jgi:uncharacterized delta-60 repeat protein